MEKTAKTDNFLKAIQKYTEENKNSMVQEVEHLKEEKLAKAHEDGKRDSEKLINDSLEKSRNAETSNLAKLISEGQKKLYLERVEMTEKVFEKAKTKLLAFTQTPAYKDELLKSAKEIADYFNGLDCVLYINEKDLNSKDKICKLFSDKTEIVADKSIKIGGIKGFCKALNIIADETLDTKLSVQREWFIENSNLSVL